MNEIHSDLDALIARVKLARAKREATSIAYHGNVVDLWERLALDYERTKEKVVDLGSDQTSLHIPFNGGYYPTSASYEDAQQVRN